MTLGDDTEEGEAKGTTAKKFYGPQMHDKQLG
jgi:hypothetical protein